MTQDGWTNQGALSAPRALVTGASSGIGMEMAIQLSAEGYHVLAVARRADRLSQLAANCPTGSIEILALDLLAPGSLEALLAEHTSEDKLPELVINNAGFGMNGRFVDADPERFRDLVELDFVVPLRICREFGAAMARRGNGRILNVASVAGFVSAPFHAVYSATKSAFLSFSEALHVELKPAGVVVSCLCPGVTDTEFFEAGGYVTKSPVYRMQRATAQSVARAGLRGCQAGKSLIVPGLSNRLLILLTRFLPRTWVTRTAGRIMSTDR